MQYDTPPQGKSEALGVVAQQLQQRLFGISERQSRSLGMGACDACGCSSACCRLSSVAIAQVKASRGRRDSGRLVKVDLSMGEMYSPAAGVRGQKSSGELIKSD